MEKNQELALTQIRKSVEKLGSSTEVNQTVTFSRLMHHALDSIKFLFHGFIFAGVWRSNTHEVLDCEVDGPRQSGKDVRPVAELEGCNDARRLHFRIRGSR